MERESKEKIIPGWVIWFVGLPGAGKSTYANAVYEALQENGEHVRYLSMDERRKSYFQIPQYTAEERVQAYKFFVKEAVSIVREGNNVIMDGTAPKLSMRENMRRLVPYFAEIYVRCPLDIAINREANRPEGQVMSDIYGKALKRKENGTYFEGLGDVIGVDTPFEENPKAECVIESDKMSIKLGRDHVLTFITTWQTI